MAWTYANYSAEATTALRLAACRAFQGEVRSAIAANVSKDGASRDSSSLNDLLRMAMEDETKYLTMPDALGTTRATGTISRVNFGSR